MSNMNRLGNSNNPHQGRYKRVLCVCSAGLLRSPTAAVVLSQEPYNYNTRAAGVTREFALIPVDEVLLDWADEIVCMEKRHEHELKKMMNKKLDQLKPVICLNIADMYRYRDPELMQLIREGYDEETKKRKEEEKKPE